MQRVFLRRFAFGPMGTFGVLDVPGADLCVYTIERPWLDNVPFKSCIPSGIYPMSKHDTFTKKGAQWRIDDVPNRSAILVHVGNTIDDVVGCVAPGLALGFVNGKWGVVSSTNATTKFNAALDGVDEAEITIAIDYDAWRQLAN